MNIGKSVQRLTIIFLALFIALSVMLVYWQVVVAGRVAANPYLTYSRGCTSENAPFRGRIFDRRGVLLAYSVKSDNPELCGYKRVYTAASQGLEGLLGYYINPNQISPGIERQFNAYLNGESQANPLDSQIKGVLHVPPQGDDIYLTVDTRIESILRKNFPTEALVSGYAYKTDRGSIIVADPSTGAILGILSEPGYDANCVVECSLETLRRDMLAKAYDKTIGCDSPCTLAQFQAALDRQKAALMAKLGPGCERFSDCNVGADCAQKRDCNLLYLRYLNSDPAQPLLFRPTQECYPPGSTYKTVTLMAALDSGTLQLHDPVFYNDPLTHPYPEHLQARGPVTVTGPDNETETFQPAISNVTNQPAYPVSLAFGFSHSDNIIFLETGVKMGADTWLKYNQALYIGQQIPFDLPVRVSTVTSLPRGGSLCAKNAQSFTPLSVTLLAEDSFGQGKDFVTPLQMMVVDNVAANDGKLMRPTLIQKIVNPQDGTVLQAFSPQFLRQVISAASAQAVRDAMYGVNACGSGSLRIVQLSYPYTSWQVIGKTGTAQVPRGANGQVLPADSWFITAAPYIYQSNQIPAITITAMKENGGEGAYANGPMLRDIYDQIFTRVLTDVHTNPVPPGGTAFCTNTKLLPD